MSFHVVNTYFKLVAGVNECITKDKKGILLKTDPFFYPGGLNKLLTGDRLILWQNTQCGSAHLLQYCIYPKLHQVIHPVHQQLQVSCREKQTKQKTEYFFFRCDSMHCDAGGPRSLGELMALGVCLISKGVWVDGLCPHECQEKQNIAL